MLLYQENKILRKVGNVMSGKIIEVQDPFNPIKVWVIKKTSCRHYYINQKINSKLFYSKFQKTTKRWLQELNLIQN